MNRREYMALYRIDPVAFLERAFLYLYPATPFIPSWHLEAFYQFALDNIEAGGQTALINAPPRSLKTTALSITLPLWLLGWTPDLRILVYCSQEAIAVNLRRRIARLSAAGWLQELFPAAYPLQDHDCRRLATRQGGGITLASVQGAPVDGVFDLIIVDDPVKHGEPNLAYALQRINAWYPAEVPHRLADSASTSLVVMPRLDERDLTASLRKQPNTMRLAIPAIAEAAERWPLFNGRRHRRRMGSILPIFGKEQLDSVKQANSAIFALRYQQRVPDIFLPLLNINL